MYGHIDAHCVNYDLELMRELLHKDIIQSAVNIGNFSWGLVSGETLKWTSSILY